MIKPVQVAVVILLLLPFAAQADEPTATAVPATTSAAPPVVTPPPTPVQATQAVEPAKPSANAADVEPKKSSRDWFSFDGLLVVFNGFLVLTTVCTAWVSNKAANAAKKSAESLPKLERAYIFLKSAISLELTGLSDPHQDGKTHEYRVQYFFKNHGKTPAFITEWKIGGGYSPNIPSGDACSYGGELPAALVVSSDMETPPHEITFRVSGENLTKAKANDGRIFFRGTVGYQDIFGEPHETSFCSQWDFGEGRFVVTKADQLNYHT